jgi:hypothetical protein
MLDTIIAKYKNNPETEPLLDEFLERIEVYKNSGSADPHFEQELKSQDNKFFQRIFEVNLYHYLIEQDFVPTSKQKGPDFKIEKDGNVVWIEAISPEPVGVPSSFLELPQKGEVRCGCLPEKQILLRITSAISNKKKKIEGYFSKKIINSGDGVILAIDCAQLGLYSDLAPNGFPPFVNALYPIGHISATIDVDRGKVTSTNYQMRKSVLNRNNTIIDTDVFLKNDYEIVSAVLGCRSGIQGIHKISLVHNYMANNKIPEYFFSCDKEYLPYKNRQEVELQVK